MGSGPSLPYGFSTPGLQHIRVTAEDSDGNAANYDITVTVAQNTPPTLTIVAPTPNKVFHTGESTGLTGKATDPNEPSGTLLCSSLFWSYRLTNGISIPVSIGTGCSQALFKFGSSGDYTITLIGTDSMGAKGSASVNVKVVEVGVPTAYITAPTDEALNADETVALKGYGNDPDSFDLIKYKWEVSVAGVRKTITFNAAQSNQTFTFPFKPSNYFPPFTCGTKKVTIFLTVTDSAGQTIEVSRDYFILFGPC